MKILLLPLVLLVSLTAYGDDRSVALSLAENNRNFRYLRIAHSFNAPVSLLAGERPGTINQELPEAQMDIQRALAAQPALQYRAEDDDTRYYLDADMQPAASAAPGGYYYKSLGKTDDNCSVLQIFYADSDRPYSAPFTLIAHLLPQDIGESRIDGRYIS